MRDISVVLLTRDRSPRQNYLADTLQNLWRAGVWQSERLLAFSIVFSNSSLDFIFQATDPIQAHVDRICESPADLPNHHVADAFLLASNFDSPWVLYVEDDIDVCSRFLDSVGSWLDDFARPEYRLYPLGTPYQEAITAYYSQHSAWKYPVKDFYGTQAVAVRSRDAWLISDWLRLPRFDVKPGYYDLHLQEWSYHYYPESPYFLGPLPNFVQHCGDQSSLVENRQKHVFQVWAGRDWSYTPAEGEVLL